MNLPVLGFRSCYVRCDNGTSVGDDKLNDVRPLAAGRWWLHPSANRSRPGLFQAAKEFRNEKEEKKQRTCPSVSFNPRESGR